MINCGGIFFVSELYVDIIVFYRHIKITCRYNRVSSTYLSNMSMRSTYPTSILLKAGFVDTTFDPKRPFNNLPNLPPAEDVETKTVLRLCIEARSALEELRVSSKLIPNPSVIINSIPILEAQASSEIENIVTTTDRLFRYASDTTSGTDPAAKEALRYRTALWLGYELVRQRPVSTSIAVEICRTIKGVNLDVRKTPGTALLNETTNDVIYTPPEGQELLRNKLGNWERYMHEFEEIDPLIRLAVMHYQFEAIHPFIDGNGRTGRVLMLLYLVDMGLLDIPVLYLSRHIIQYKAKYYELLREVTASGSWEAWILFMLEAIRSTAKWTSAKVQSIRDLVDATAATIRHQLPKIYSRELAELIFENPYCRIRNLVEADVAQRHAASDYLKALVTVDILEEVKVGREKLYINPSFLKLLSD